MNSDKLYTTDHWVKNIGTQGVQELFLSYSQYGDPG